MTDPARRTTHLIGIPLDHGAGRRGVSMGPSALRIAGLHRALAEVGCEVIEHGDIEVAIPERSESRDSSARFLPVVASACSTLSESVSAAISSGGFPLVIGGDHSIAIGTISGVAHALRERNGSPAKIGVLWIDAHADLNTPATSPSGNIHGMPLSCLLGDGPRELTDLGFPGPKIEASRIVQVGLRDVDQGEKARIRESGITAYTMADVDRRGIAQVMRESIEVVTRDCDFLHVSFDIDVLDPQAAPGTGTPVRGGLTFREAHLALELIAETGRLGSFELVEVNPILDDRNRTAELAVGLIASAFGKTIL